MVWKFRGWCCTGDPDVMLHGNYNSAEKEIKTDEEEIGGYWGYVEGEASRTGCMQIILKRRGVGSIHIHYVEGEAGNSGGRRFWIGYLKTVMVKKE
jgi:hypothetical protein